MKLIVLAFAYELPYHTVRLAALAGHEVHVLGQQHAQGFRWSRACRSFNLLATTPGVDPPSACAAEIADWVRRLGADAVVPTDILGARLLASVRPQIPVPVPPGPDARLFDALNDKWQFFELAREHGLPVPDTWIVQGPAALRAMVASGERALPLVVKPVTGMGGNGVCMIDTSEQLEALDFPPDAPMLVQTRAPGRDRDISVLADRGRLIGWAVQRRDGNTYDFSDRPALRSMIERFVAAIGLSGLAHFDAIESPDGRDYQIIECNPRVWYSIFAIAAAGLNIVDVWLRAAEFGKGKPLTVQHRTVPVGRELLRRSQDPAVRWMRRYALADPFGWLADNRHLFCDEKPGAGDVQWQLARLESLVDATR